MNVRNARLESFKSRRVPKNHFNKSTSSSGTILVKWPHPPSFKATPATLADAGFIFAPTASCRDNVVCFLCNKELSEWSEDDDPAEVHFNKCADFCSWASVKCGLAQDLNEYQEFIAVDSSRLPSGKVLEKCRLDTFTGWPHDASRGHGANSKKMAKAGFVYMPHAQDDDSASCLYCGIILSGWEYDDDPMEEHHKRDRKLNRICTFFSAKTPTPGKSVLFKPSSRTSAKPRSRPRSTRMKQTPIETEQSSADDADTLRMSTRTTRSAKSRSEVTKPPAPTTSRRTTGASKGKAAAAGPEVEDQSGSDAGKTFELKSRRTKSKGKITAIAEEEEYGQVEEAQAEEEPLRKSKRGKGKVKVKEVFGDIEMELALMEPQKRPPPRRQTRSKSRAKVESDSDAVVHTKPIRIPPDSDSEAEPLGILRRPTAVKRSPPKSKVKHSPSRAGTTREKMLASSPKAEPSDVQDIPQKIWKPRSKAKSSLVESESEDTWQSALEEPGSAQFTKTSKKPSGQTDSFTRVSGGIPKPSHDEVTSLSDPELPKSLTLSSKPVRKPASKTAPFHDKSSNHRLHAEADVRIGSHATSRTSLGSKENATALSKERELQAHRIIDISDDAEDLTTKKPASSRPISATVVPDPPTVSGSETKSSRRIKKLEVVIERRTPERTSQTKEVIHESDVAMEIDVNTESHLPARPNNRNHDRGEKPSTKQTAAAGVPLQKRPILKQGTTDSDSAMDVDGHEPLRRSPPPSTPPRVVSTEESNPFSFPAADNNNPLLAFEAPFGKLPAETVFTLTEDEKDMTIEEWTKRELEIQLANFRRDGHRRIQEFKDRAAEVRRQIEAL